MVGHAASVPGAHPTTVSGQASAAPARRSSAPWIALAALVVGGGITAAVVSGRSPGVALAPGAPGPAGIPMPPTAPAMPTPSRLGSFTPSAPTPVAPGQWFTYRALSFPGWDPRNIDVDAYIAWAIQNAKQTIPDAALIRIDATNVYPDGHADLTLSSSGFLMVQFISPSRSKRDPSLPVGAQPEGRCMFQVMATVQTGPFISPHSMSCDDLRPQPIPRCTLRGVWQQMIDHKAPSGNVVAQIDYFAPDKGKPARWFTSVTGRFSERFPDACP
jgi:hypothetical protein